MTHPPDSASPETKVCGNQAVSSAEEFLFGLTTSLMSSHYQAHKMTDFEKEKHQQTMVHIIQQRDEARDKITRAQAIDETLCQLQDKIDEFESSPEKCLSIIGEYISLVRYHLNLKTPGGTI